jgi:2-polyprenyl-6-methoxyphenol hydroxylase-like FAD-dependent oxidoreductase
MPKVCIVGSGPVGMVLSRMLTRLNISNLVLEKYPSLQNHPKAHYLSFRSCEIL